MTTATLDRPTGRAKLFAEVANRLLTGINDWDGESHLGGRPGPWWPVPRHHHGTIPTAEAIAERYLHGDGDGPEVRFREGWRSSFEVLEDVVVMPGRNQFDTLSSFYRVLFHELVHSTGMPWRLGRFPIQSRHDYFVEELIAEIGSAFLCARAGILDDVIDQHIEYLAGYLSGIPSDEWEDILPHVFRQACLAAEQITHAGEREYRNAA